MKYLIISIICCLLAFSGYKAIKLSSDYAEFKLLKEDLAEINKINYGLFNLQIWKKEALLVFENRIQEFEISSRAYDQAVVELDKYLRGIYREYIESGKIFDGIFAEAEKSEKVNKMLLKLIKENTKPQIQLLNIPKFIPGMAVQLANELKKQEPQLRDIMRQELKKIIKDTDSTRFIDPRASIFAKYNTQTLEATNEVLTSKITTQQLNIDHEVKILYGCLISAFIISIVFLGQIGFNTSVTLITINSIILLLLGINLPMIDIEAMLNSFNIKVLGTTIGFDKQYMYYQSKSILDVTMTLIKGRGIDLKIVGLMILLFSIVFPFLKLVLSTLYLYNKRVQESSLVQNIIFYLGKWSMADVFVVALFMAYIGFYGIITSQLNSVANNEGGFAVETINNSRLSPGALFFTTYCIFSIVIGIMINRRKVV